MSPAPSISTWEGGIIHATEDTRWYYPGGTGLDGDHQLVIWAHGRNGTEEQLHNTRHIWDLAAAGYLVVTADYGGPLAYGNDTAIQRVQDVIDRAVNTGRASSSPPILIGASMGALTVLNWQRQSSVKAPGAILIWGAVNLEATHSNPTYTSEINTAYGGTYSSVTDGPDHDPSVYYADLVGTTILTFYGENDTIAAPSLEASFASDFAGAGGSITRTSLGATGHFDTQAITSEQIINAVQSL